MNVFPAFFAGMDNALKRIIDHPEAVLFQLFLYDDLIACFVDDIRFPFAWRIDIKAFSWRKVLYNIGLFNAEKRSIALMDQITMNDRISF